MPFADFGSAAHADVRFDVNTGQFRAAMGEVGAVYNRTTAQMTDEAIRLSLAQEKVTRAVQQSGPQSAAAMRATAAYRQEMDRLGQAGLTTVQRLQQLEPTARTIGRNVSRYITVPTALATVAAVKMAVDFQQTMSRIEGLVGASRSQVRAWSDEILRLGPQLAKSPRELGEALYFITSSGIEGAAALDVLRVAAKASAAGLGETQTLADLLTSALNAYGDSNLTAAQAADVLVAAVKAGKLEASDLAEVLGTVLPLASRLDVPFYQVAAAIEAMSLTGTDAEEARTQLVAFFSSLIKVTPQAEKELNRVGLSAEQLRQELAGQGLLSVLQTLDKAFDGNITSLARVFPNIRALRNQLALTGPQAEQVADVFAATEKSAGAMGRAFQVAADQDGFKLRQALELLRADLIRLGDEVAPAVVFVAESLAFLADTFDKLPRTSKIALGSLIALLAVSGPLIVGIFTVIRAVAGIGTAFRLLPVQAAPGIAATSAELVALQVQAGRTAAAVGTIGPAAVAGGTVASRILAYTGGEAVIATGKVAGLRTMLLGLGALTIAPIVIPIIVDWYERNVPESVRGILGPIAVGGVELDAERYGIDTRTNAQIRAEERRRRESLDELEAARTGRAVEGRSPGRRFDPIEQARRRAATERRRRLKALAEKQPLTADQRLSLQLAEAELTAGTGDDLRVLREQAAQFEREAAQAKRALDRALETGQGDPGKLADKYEQLLGKQKQAQDRVAQIVAENARTERERRDRAGQAREAAQREREAAVERQRQAYSEAQQAAENELQINLLRAQLAERKAGDNQKALDRAYAAERRAQQALIDFYRRQAAAREHLTRLERQEARKKAIAAEQAKLEITQRLREEKATADDARRALEREFLESFNQIIAQFAPNFLGPGQRPNVTVVQNFPHPPTADGHREARLGKLAAEAAFEE